MKKRHPFFPLFLMLLLFAESIHLPASADSITAATNAAPEPANVTLESNAHLREARRLKDSGDLTGALNEASQAIQKDPKNSFAYIINGSLLMSLKKWSEAEDNYKKLREIDPANDAVPVKLAEIQFRQDKFDLARDAFVEIEKNKDPDIRDYASYYIFLCDLFGNKPDQAKQELDDFNKVESHPSFYFANISWALSKNKNDEARQWYSSAIKIYSEPKILLYSSPLKERGMLPIPLAP